MITWFLYLALLAVVFRGIVGRPDWTVIASAFFVTMTQVMPNPLGVISAPANILMLGLAVSWFRSRPPEIKLRTPLRRLIFLMTAFIIISYLHRLHLELVQGYVYANTVDGMMAAVKEMVMAYAAYWFVYRLVQVRETLIHVWWAVLLCAGGEALLAVYEKAQGVGRASAHLADPNRAGGYLAAAAALFLAVFLLQKGIFRALGAGGFVMAVAGVFATLSRGAILALTMAMFVVLLIFYLKIREGASKLMITLLVVVGAMNFALLLPQSVHDRIMMTVGGAENLSSAGEEDLDQSADERLALWGAAMRMMADRPLGFGFLTFSTEVGDYLDRYQRMRKVAHNIYLQVGVEMGIPALVTLILLVVGVLLTIWRSLRQAGNLHETCIDLGLMGGWVAMVVSVMFMNPFFAFNFSGWFWILLGARLKIRNLAAARAKEGGNGPGRLPAARAWAASRT